MPVRIFRLGPTPLMIVFLEWQFKESVRKFAQENIAPYAAQIDHQNMFPKDVNLWKKMGEFDLHGITVPGELSRLCFGNNFERFVADMFQCA
jgi:isovaleryl-CoA dehydrogenase